MPAIWSCLLAASRSQWRAWLSLSLLVGVFGAVVLAAAAGARRTETAYVRFLEATDASHVYISPFEVLLRGSYDEIRQLPQVQDAGLISVPLLAQVSSEGAGNFLIFSTASVDGRYGYTINRPKVLRGRLPDPGDPRQTLIDPTTASKLGVTVGDEISLRAFDRPPADGGNIAPDEGVPATFDVVGIGVFSDRVVRSQIFDEFPRLFLTPAAHRLYGASPTSVVYEEIFVRLKPGADVAAFRSEVDRITGADPGAGGNDFNLDSDRTAKVQRAIRPQAVALAVFAGLAAIAGLLIVGQILTRQIFLESTEHPTLRALGMTRRQLVLTVAARVVAIGLGGAMVAITLAIVASPLFPIGPARIAEPRPGMAANVGVLVGGAGVLVVLLVGAVALPMWRAASAKPGGGVAEIPGSSRPSRLVRLLIRAGAPSTAIAGVRFAVEPGHARSAAPVRATLAGTVLALVAVIGSLTFGDSLDRVISDPRRYGQQWDVALDGGFTMMPTASVVARLRDDPSIAAFSGGNSGEVTIDGQQVPAVGIDRLHGSLFPTLLEGRPPEQDDEIVLGTKVLRRIGKAVGDELVVEVGGATRQMRVVGRAVFPSLGLPTFAQTGLGEGAAVAGDVLPPASSQARSPEDIYNYFLVQFAPGATSADRQRLEAETHRDGGPFGDACERNASSTCFFTNQRPTDIANYARVRATPVALAGLLVLLGLATLVHALLSSIHRRRRDFAILVALGFVRRQVWATVAWQASTVSTLTLVVGLPLGIVVGRWAWIIFADQLGVDPSPVVPRPAVLIAIPAVIVMANLVALLPGRLAGRIPPAEALREP